MSLGQNEYTEEQEEKKIEKINNSLAILANSGIKSSQDFLRGILTAKQIQQVVQMTLYSSSFFTLFLISVTHEL